MTTSYPDASGIAKPKRRTLTTAKQSWHDLFIWKQRVETEDQSGAVVTEWHNPAPLKNPFNLLMQLSAKDWLYFSVGFAAWVSDAFDFHSVGYNIVKLGKYYHTSNTAITTAITLTLLLRSIGAAVFGLLADRFGRKWPMAANLLILGALQFATIYCATFAQFLAVRSLFGLFMGGVYGSSIAMALENAPTDARGILSGILQQGYSMAYIMIACINLGIGGRSDSWKTIFWIAGGMSIVVGFLRMCVPESKQFIEARKAGLKAASPGDFWENVKDMLAKEWRLTVYCIILMTWYNFYSHTSQDSYSTFMLVEKELGNSASSRASIYMKFGTCVGSILSGWASQFLGRRRVMVIMALMSACLIPAWIIPNDEHTLSASGFLIQFCIGGSWGVIPIHLNELSPPAFRSSFPGVTYQIGNMLSSPSVQLVNAIAESHLVTSSKGDRVPGYGLAMGIATGIIAVAIVTTTIFGPEKCGRQFEDIDVVETVTTAHPKSTEKIEG